MTDFYEPHKIQADTLKKYPVKMLKFGWRYYTEEGDSEEKDEEGNVLKKYYGFDDTYDEEIEAASPRI